MSEETKVVVTGFDIPFGKMVKVMFKFWLASLITGGVIFSAIYLLLLFLEKSAQHNLPKKQIEHHAPIYPLDD